MNTKICTKCGIEKSIDEFGTQKQYGKDYRRTHCNDCRRNYQREYNKTNREKINEKNRKYAREHKEEFKKYYEQHKEHYKKAHRNYEREKAKNDEIYLLKKQTRRVLWRSFNRKSFKKIEHTEKILGCNIEEFIKYLLQTYKKNYGYEWDGKEKIHIDHIFPLKYATTEEEIIRLCHYKNLQLLKQKDNLEKRAKLNWKLGE